jgi:hypothetical protein
MVSPRTPYFLYAALAVPIVDIIALLLMEGLPHSNTGGNAGNYDLSGLAIIIPMAGISTVVGLAFSVISLWKNERARWLSAVCVIFYALPFLWTATQVLSFVLSKARYDRSVQEQKALPTQ